MSSETTSRRLVGFSVAVRTEDPTLPDLSEKIIRRSTVRDHAANPGMFIIGIVVEL
jgi:hypothetical protein